MTLTDSETYLLMFRFLKFPFLFQARQKSRSIWDCFGGRRKKQESAKGEKKMPKSGYSPDQQEGPYPARPNGDRLRRIIGCLLIPFFLFVAAAAVAIVVIIWYM
jgi:hypothetical protein